MAEVDYMLCFACQSGDVRMVRSCLSSGADVNTTEIVGLTPLQIAMRNNHPNVIAELLNWDIDITAADGCGITILHWACWMGATELVSVLRNDSCMTDALLNIKDRDGMTALMVAVQRGHLPCVEELALSECLDWEAQDMDGH